MKNNLPVHLEIYIYIAAIIILLLVIGYIISTYNMLIRINENVDKSWSNISILLQQRNNEIPQLVSTCKKYMQHESQTLKKVVSARNIVEEARSKADIKMLNFAENKLHDCFESLNIVIESYPTIKANETFLKLQNRIIHLENSIADRREFFNDSVTIYNIRIKQFPILYVAKMLFLKEKARLKFPPVNLSEPQLFDKRKS